MIKSKQVNVTPCLHVSHPPRLDAPEITPRQGIDIIVIREPSIGTALRRRSFIIDGTTFCCSFIQQIQSFICIMDFFVKDSLCSRRVIGAY